jgi:hypothetical protein
MEQRLQDTQSQSKDDIGVDVVLSARIAEGLVETDLNDGVVAHR